MIVLAPGPLALEAALRRQLDELLPPTVDSLRGAPLRIIVPSLSLRQHVSAMLVRQQRRSVAALSVQTLFAVAIEILERSGVGLADADTIFPVLVAQAAQNEACLRQELGELSDGYAAVLPTVADLLDAGLSELHADALDELLAALPGGHAVDRARALVRVAARTLAELQRLGISRSSMLLQQAADLVQRDPDTTLPARALLIHGFADVTGVAGDFIEALARSRETHVFIDVPPEPASRDSGLSAIYSQRLRQRLAYAGERQEGEATLARLDLVAAPGVQAEVRSIAERIRVRLDSGTAPESIAIVARDLSAYAVPIRIHFARLGIPFSGLSATATINAAGRRVRALIEVLRRRRSAPTDRWLDVVANWGASVTLDDTARLELRVGLRANGAARLRDVAALDAATLLRGKDRLPLPMRHGLTPRQGHEQSDHEADADDEAEEFETAPIALRRQLRGELLHAAIDAARALLTQWSEWPESATITRHLEHLTALAPHLGWPALELDLPALRDLSRQVPGELSLEYSDFITLLARALATTGIAPLGGSGGGVQILTVMEARGRCWAELFVAGMNRDVFPRSVREDALLPDWLRQSIAAGGLPDLPIKARGFDEERFLFAQLLSSSPQVTLSWQAADDAGKVLSPSPLVERLRLTARHLEITAAPPLYARPRNGDTPAAPSPTSRSHFLHPPYEHAVLAGLYGGRADLTALLPLAARDAQTRFGGYGNSDLALQARERVLAEIDPDLRSTEGRRRSNTLGPYFGFIGAIPARQTKGANSHPDPRHNKLYVTTLERFASCPWQTFVQRLLPIELPPDPLATLPALDMRIIGSAVHLVLERIACQGAGTSGTGAAGWWTTARPAAWPAPAALTQLVAGAAEEVLRQSGVALPGLTRVLATLVQPYIDMAQQIDWSAQPPMVGGVEVEATLTVSDTSDIEHLLHFRADRVDMQAGVLQLTDYKTGKPLSDAKREATRRSKLLAGISKGTLLQAATYAHTTPGVHSQCDSSVGRYLYLRPDTAVEARRIDVTADDVEAETIMRATVATLLQGWQEGSFFPRLLQVGKNEAPPACKYCDVASACLYSDSGARRRLHAWDSDSEAADASVAELAMRQAWALARTPDKPSKPDKLEGDR